MLKSFPSKFQEAWQCLLGDGVELHSLPWALLTLCPRRSQELYEALMVDGDDDGAEPAGEQMAQAPRSLPPEVRAREPESPRARPQRPGTPGSASKGSGRSSVHALLQGSPEPGTL